MEASLKAGVSAAGRALSSLPAGRAYEPSSARIATKNAVYTTATHLWGSASAVVSTCMLGERARIASKRGRRIHDGDAPEQRRERERGHVLQKGERRQRYQCDGRDVGRALVEAYEHAGMVRGHPRHSMVISGNRRQSAVAITPLAIPVRERSCVEVSPRMPA